MADRTSARSRRRSCRGRSHRLDASSRSLRKKLGQSSSFNAKGAVGSSTYVASKAAMHWRPMVQEKDGKPGPFGERQTAGLFKNHHGPTAR